MPRDHRNGRPDAVLMAVMGAIEQIRQTEFGLAAGKGIDADELRRLLAIRVERESRSPRSTSTTRSRPRTRRRVSTAPRR